MYRQDRASSKAPLGSKSDTALLVNSRGSVRSRGQAFVRGMHVSKSKSTSVGCTAAVMFAVMGEGDGGVFLPRVMGMKNARVRRIECILA